MQDYAIPCPGCSFVLRFHDPALFGRRARCPQCHQKFILDEAPNRSAASPSIARGRRAEAPAQPAVSSAALDAPPPARSVAPAASPAENGCLSDGLSCGFRSIRQSSRRRWTVPDPLSIPHAAFIAVGAAAGAAAATWSLPAPSALISCLSATAGGLLAAAGLAARLR